MLSQLTSQDRLSLVKECAQKAANFLVSQEDLGMRKQDVLLNFYGEEDSRYSDRQFLGILASDKLPHGMGIKLNDQGKITFFLDEHETGWQREAERMQKLFRQAFVFKLVENFFIKKGDKIELEKKEIENPRSSQPKLRAELFVRVKN